MSDIPTLQPNDFLNSINSALGASYTSLPDAWVAFLQTRLSSASVDVSTMELDWLDSITSTGSISTEDQWNDYLTTTLGFSGSIPDMLKLSLDAGTTFNYGPNVAPALSTFSFTAPATYTAGTYGGEPGFEFDSTLAGTFNFSAFDTTTAMTGTDQHVVIRLRADIPHVVRVLVGTKTHDIAVTTILTTYVCDLSGTSGQIIAFYGGNGVSTNGVVECTLFTVQEIL